MLEGMVKVRLQKLIKSVASVFVFLSILVQSAWALQAGDVAPDFEALNQDGKIVKFSQFQGKPVILYFYPKDDTPGCRKEACHFRDQGLALQKWGAVVVGLSRQDVKSKKQFAKKHKLPFDLLVDEDGAIAKKYGVGLMPIIGLHKRQTVLVAPNGRVAKFYENVDPDTHVDEVLADLKNLFPELSK